MTLGGRSVGVFNVGGRFFALRNRCPHQGGPLCEGPVSRSLRSSTPGEYLLDDRSPVLRCPWHGWEFDMEEGRSWFNPERVRVRTYPVTLEAPGNAPDEQPASSDRVPGPYHADVYPVSVEDGVVVVHIVRASVTTDRGS